MTYLSQKESEPAIRLCDNPYAPSRTLCGCSGAALRLRGPRRSFFDPPILCCLTVSTLATDQQFAGPTPRSSSSLGTTNNPTTTPEGQKEATLAAHPFQTGPNGVDEAMLR